MWVSFLLAPWLGGVAAFGTVGGFLLADRAHAAGGGGVRDHSPERSALIRCVEDEGGGGGGAGDERAAARARSAAGDGPGSGGGAAAVGARISPLQRPADANALLTESERLRLAPVRRA